jgi:hypothetical protein
MTLSDTIQAIQESRNVTLAPVNPNTNKES